MRVILFFYCSEYSSSQIREKTYHDRKSACNNSSNNGISSSSHVDTDPRHKQFRLGYSNPPELSMSEPRHLST